MQVGGGGREGGEERGVWRWEEGRNRSALVLYDLQTGPPPKRTRPVMMNTAEEEYDEDKDDATLFLIGKKGECYERVSVRGVGHVCREGECEGCGKELSA